MRLTVEKELDRKMLMAEGLLSMPWSRCIMQTVGNNIVLSIRTQPTLLLMHWLRCSSPAGRLTDILSSPY